LRYFAIGLLIGAAVGLASCQNTAPPPASSNAVSVDHSAEARNAFAARDWGKAAPHFRAAIAVDPGSLTLHHGLATCASWLGLLDEAKAEFNWVLAHAPAGSPEARRQRMRQRPRLPRMRPAQRSVMPRYTVSSPGKAPAIRPVSCRGRRSI
jgi:hypothetical protein